MTTRWLLTQVRQKGFSSVGAVVAVGEVAAGESGVEERVVDEKEWMFARGEVRRRA